MLYAALAARHDLREAWLGLAACQLRLGQLAPARASLAEILAGHAGPHPPHLAALLTRAGFSAWVWYQAGRVHAHGARRLTLHHHGRRLAAPPARPPLGPYRLGVSADQPLPIAALDLARIRRLDAFIDIDDQGGITGFAWHPNDPATAPALTLIAANGRRHRISLGPPGSAAANQADRHDRPLAAPRRLALAAASLPGPGPYRIVTAAGQGLPGSPIDPAMFTDYARAAARLHAGATPAAASLRAAPIPVSPAPPAPARAPAHAHADARGGTPAIAVLIPVYGAAAVTRACLAAMLAHTPPQARRIVIDDATPDPDLAAHLDQLAASGRIELIRHPRNLGFPAAVNTGLAAAPGHDVVLLNADTLVPPGWLPRLAAAAHAAADIGTATPFSNDATLLNYPNAEGENPVPDAAMVAHLARLAHRAGGARIIDIPTGVGFCLYITTACLRATGRFRAEIFAQGYGEENDFCRRAAALGFRHVAATGLFVGHVGGQSFGATRKLLLARNLVWLNRLHPGYDALIAADASGPARAKARRRLDLARLEASLAREKPPGAVLLVTHDVGGGVEAQVQARVTAIRAQGLRPVLLRPVLRRPYLEGTGQCRIDLPAGADALPMPNLVFDVATERASLLRTLRRLGPVRLEFHHRLGHPPALLALPRALGLPYSVYLHDYAWFCPRVTLTTPDGRYCGEPDLSGCAACIADHGALTDDPTPVADLVSLNGEFLAAATEIIAPSAATASAYRRHFPRLTPKITRWDDIRPPALPILPPATRARPRRVVILGAIGTEKGYDTLLACARDAARRGLPLHFTLVGHSIDDARLLETGTIFVTGEYKKPELPALLAAHAPQLGFLPATWPETWSFTLSELWAAGLAACVFDLGAPAERIRAEGGGAVLPLAASPPQVNQALLTLFT